MSDVVYWIWLSMSLNPASLAFRELLEQVGDAKAIYECEAEALNLAPSLTAQEKEKLAKRDLRQAEEVATYCLQNSIHMIPHSSKEYPTVLRSIKDPPVMLFLKGKIPDWNLKLCIGMVGTRAMTQYGAECTLEIAYDLARIGCITVSGMALGIDGMCAGATLHAGGVTVAVLGSGIDVVYPHEHEFLYQCILQNGGAIVTEFLPETPPHADNFPIRNRIISGISKALIVVEGEAGSGSMITARRATEQGRAVFAVPSHIGRLNGEAPLLLLKHKMAAPITCADDIYDSFKQEYMPHLNAFKLLEPHPEHDASRIVFKYRLGCGKPKLRLSPSAEKELERREKKRQSLLGAALSLVKGVAGVERPDPQKEEEQLQEQSRKEISEKEQRLLRKMNEDEQKIYKQMPYGEEVEPDAILLVDKSPDDIMSIMTEMELKGFLATTCGGKYTKLLE